MPLRCLTVGGAHACRLLASLTYATIFDGGDASEEFVYRLDPQPALAGYHINSEALLLK